MSFPTCRCCPPRAALPHGGRRRLLQATAAGLAGGLLAPLRARPAVAQAGSGRPLLFRGGTILTMDPALPDLPRGDVLVDGERIAAIGPALEVGAAEVIDASGTIVMPGFVDTHRHMWEGLLRNILPDGTLQQYLSVVLARLGPAFRPEDVFAGNLLSALGALDAGITTVLDWSHIQNTPAHTDAAIAALREAGIRAVFGYGAPQLGRRWWETEGHPYPGDLRRVRRQHIPGQDGLLTLALAASGPLFGNVEVAEREWHIAREVGARITTHVGVGPGSHGNLARFAAKGLLGPDGTYIHCNFLEPAEWRLIAESGGTVSLSPQIELQMGHGLPAVQAALDAGLRPSLSADAETSVPSDMFTQMRAAFAAQRGMLTARQHNGETGLPPLLTAMETLRFATIDGARANGLEARTGSLTPGKQADLIMLRADRINVLPMNDPAGVVVTGMDTSNVDTVVVAGAVRKRNGALVGVDMARLKALVEESRRHVLGRL